jgi:protoheme IX farnesyltransferase
MEPSQNVRLLPTFRAPPGEMRDTFDSYRHARQTHRDHNTIAALHTVDPSAAVTPAPMNTSDSDRPGLQPLLEVVSRLEPWVQLAKPGVTRLVLITTLFGGLVAPGSRSLGAWLLMLAGTALVVAAANAFNMVYEADADALMSRTRDRPIPRGRLGKPIVARVASLALGVGLLALFAVDTVATALAFVAFASYVWVYTPLKRTTPHALYVGTIPGAIPPLIGYASVTRGELDLAALVLFALLAVWQVPHFLAIAVFRRDEYERAGFKVFTVCRSRSEVRRLMLVWSALLFAVSLVPVWLGMGGTLYAAIAVGFGLPFVLGAAYGLRSSANDDWARSLFFASMPLLVVLFVGLAL